MEKKEKMVCQIIRFLGKIETFLALIDVLQSICVAVNMCCTEHCTGRGHGTGPY